MRRKKTWKLIAFIAAWLILISGCAGEMPDLGAVFMSTPTATPPNTPIPSPTATLVPDLDFDQDGLSNISELVKYGTNPYEQDSDNDGIPDGDWDERREYRYSVRVIMRIRQPFDLEAMNDDMFQDARIVEQEDAEGYSTLEILLFPITGIPLTPSAFPPTDLPQEVQAYTLPGLTTNFSQAMQEEVDNIVGNATNDVHAVYEILEWISINVRADRNRHARALVFYYTYEVDEAVYLRNLWPGVSGNVMQGTYLYADSMYWNSTTGDSCSYSTLMCSMLRAAGLPCRILQTLDPIYSHVEQSQEYVSTLERFWNDEYENHSAKPAEWLNHCYMEAYLGGVWVRVGETINFYQESRFYDAYQMQVDTLNIKILSVADLTEVNFSQTYPTNWITERPYYTLQIEDQDPIH